MRIYCFDIDGNPPWPSGTAIAARDLRTSCSVLLYRSLDKDLEVEALPEPMPVTARVASPDPVLQPGEYGDLDFGSFPAAGLTSPRRRHPAAALEHRHRARTVLNKFSVSATTTLTQVPRRAVDLFSCQDFILIAAPDAATAAPVLKELREHGLFQDVKPALCSACHKSRPTTPAGLCQACTQLKKEEEILAWRREEEAVRRAKLRRRRSKRALLALSLLVAITVVALYLWQMKPDSPQTAAPVRAPIAQISVNHQSVKRGSRVLLSWNTSGLSTPSISPGIGSVPVSGKRWVVINRDTTFSLLGTGTGYTSPATVTVSVLDLSAGSEPKASADSIPSAPPQSLPETSSQSASVSLPSDRSAPDPGSEAKYRVAAALDIWAAAYQANDPRRQAALYAPQVERFFLHENVDSAYVLSYMSTFYARGSHFTSFSFTNPEITVIDADNARASVVKNYTLQLADGGSRNVVSRSELHFIRTFGGVWKINFERDFKA